MRKKGNLISLISVLFILLVSMAMGGCATPLTNAALNGDIKETKSLLSDGEESLTVFPQVFSVILDNYVEQPPLPFLTLNAANGMEDMLSSNNKTFTKPDINLDDIKDDKNKAIRLVSSIFNNFLSTTDVKPKELEYAAIKRMLKSLDPNSSFLTPDEFKGMQVETKGVFGGVGIEIGIRNEILTVVAPIDDSPAYTAGIKAGDKILKINNEPTTGMTILNAVKRMRGPAGTSVTLAIMREGFNEPKEFKIVREIIKIKSVKYKFLEEGSGYIRISQFHEKTAYDVEDALNKLGSKDEKLKGLVIDLRNNPGGLLSVAVDVADKFIDSDLIVSLKGRIPSSNMKFEGKTLGTHLISPIIVLVNKGTASGTEIVAGALQDLNKAVILGERTFGKGNVQTIIPLSDGSAIRLTTSKYYLPSGRPIQSGIIPDVEIAEIEGTDALLSIAQSAIKKSQVSGARSTESVTKIVRGVLKEEKPKLAIKEVPLEDIHNIPDFKASLQPNDLAIIIGIEGYQNIPKSDFSKSDAGIVKDYLKALGFAERNIELITDERATFSGITKSIEAWLPNRVKPDSRVFVYYSGHGAPDPQTGEAYLVPYDGDPNYLSVTGYPLKRLYDNLGKLQVAEVIVVLDSCFSGAGGRSVLAKGARPLVMMTTSIALPQNMAVLSATQGSQISTSSSEKGHGVFTYYFLKALKDGKKTVAEIYEYIKPQVEDEAKQLNVQQSPSISPDVDKLRGRFSLRK